VAAARIAVVGGGLSGLAAAQRLNAEGYAVELFERSRLLGGRATSFEVGGETVDNGQHVYLACCTQFIEFIDRAGMAAALRLQDRFDVAVYSRDGKFSRLRAARLPAPLHLLASFIAYRHLSWRGKLQVARALLRLKCDPDAAQSAPSFGGWLQSQGQSDETVCSFWEPFMVPALNAPLDQMNAAEAAFVVSTAFLSDSGAARFGYSSVPLAEIMEAAARPLDSVHRSTAVLGVEADDRISLRSSSGTAAFDGAVVAVSPAALRRLLGEPQRFGIGGLDAYESFPIVDAHLWHDRGTLDFDFAAILDSPVQWVFQKRAGYLCCSLSAVQEWASEPSASLAQRMWEEVRRALPQLASAKLLRSAVTRNPEGTYLVKPGAKRPGARTAHPKLTIAGSWTETGWPDTMESAVRSGETAAQSLMERL